MPKPLLPLDTLLLGVAEPMLMLPLILATALLLAVAAALLTVMQLGRALLPVHSPPPLRSRPASPGRATATLSPFNR